MSAPPSALRLKLRHAGYDPIPAEGKIPPLNGWQEKINVGDDDICSWSKTYPSAHNTGVLAKRAPGLDIDITLPDAADAAEALAREHFEERGDIRVRTGRAPRRLIPLRTDEPFAKLVRTFTAPDGSVQKIEILSDGQQYIVAGIHPDTQNPYSWQGGELEKVQRKDLPYVRREDMERFLDDAALLLVTNFGFSDLSTAQPTANGGGVRPERTDTRWRELNERALANLDKWVPKLFPTAKKTKAGGYRVSSADLGRGREKDLSLTPQGIKYFGDADMGDAHGGRRTAIDTVMEWDHVTFADAARWLEHTLNGGGNPQPQPKPQPQPGPQPQPKQYRFKLKPFDSIAVSAAPNYLIKGILPHTGLVVVWGPPKCGKSFWTFDAVMHVVLGREYRSRRVQQGTVVYCALDGGSGFAGRIVAWRLRNLDGCDQPVPFFLVDVSLDLIADRNALISDIRDQLGDATMPAVVVIDTLNRAISGDENRSDDMAKFIRAADAVREAFNCLVIIVHHCGIVSSRPRGHTSLAGADDAQIAVVRDKDGIVTATVEHAKDFESGTKFACKLERVELGTDTEGDELSSCIVVPVDAKPAEAAEPGKASGRKSAKQPTASDLGLSILKKLVASIGQPPPADLNLPADCRVVKALVWRETFYAAYASDKQGNKQRAFFRVNIDLVDKKLIGFLNEYVWPEPDNPDNSDKTDL